jgi:hypothetical protein
VTQSPVALMLGGPSDQVRFKEPYDCAGSKFLDELLGFGVHLSSLSQGWLSTFEVWRVGDGLRELRNFHRFPGML